METLILRNFGWAGINQGAGFMCFYAFLLWPFSGNPDLVRNLVQLGSGCQAGAVGDKFGGIRSG